MTRRSFCPRDAKRRGSAAPAAPAPIAVSDHAIVRYFERVLGYDIEDLRATIGAACARHGAAPSVRIAGARFIIRAETVVTVLADSTVPHFEGISSAARQNGEETT